MCVELRARRVLEADKLSMRLRVGILGLGAHWETRHQPALKALADRFEVRAVCTEVALQAEQAARQFDAQAIGGFRSLLARDDIDAVLLLGSQWYGALPAMAACDTGKAIYCAIVSEMTADQASAVRNRVNESGVAFMAEFPRRQAPATVRLKELIATRLGRPRMMFCHRRLPSKDGNGRRTACRESLIHRELVELVDWCRYVSGVEPTSVIGVGRQGIAVGDVGDNRLYQMMSLDFSPRDQPGGGPLAQISCGHYIPEAWSEAINFRSPAELQVCCERGVAFIDLPSSLVWFDEAGRQVESLEAERPVGEQLLLQFYRDVTSLVQRASGLEDAYRALQVVWTAQASAEQGRRLPIDDKLEAPASGSNQ
jgi:predicted dehydrogenase